MSDITLFSPRSAGNRKHQGIKLSIKQHYDGCSDHYNGLWGKHIHHGLWVKGDETKEEAQEELIRTLLRHAKLPPNPRILDVGCGVGGTSCYLASSLNATVIGVTISTRQVVMATEGAAKAGVSERVTFVEGDGERLDELDILAGQAGTFDAVWISEALSHFVNKDAFFRHAHNFVKPGCVLGWCWGRRRRPRRGACAPPVPALPISNSAHSPMALTLCSFRSDSLSSRPRRHLPLRYHRFLSLTRPPSPTSSLSFGAPFSLTSPPQQRKAR